MSVNELLTVPDVPEQTAAEAEQVQEYEYTRKDGTVEHARNAKEVFDKCPVLGKIAIEAPDEANMLLELAAIGRAKMQEQTAKPAPKEETAKAETAKAEPQAEMKVSEAIPEKKVVAAEQVAVEQNLEAETLDITTEHKVAETHDPTQEETHRYHLPETEIVKATEQLADTREPQVLEGQSSTDTAEPTTAHVAEATEPLVHEPLVSEVTEQLQPTAVQYEDALPVDVSADAETPEGTVTKGDVTPIEQLETATVSEEAQEVFEQLMQIGQEHDTTEVVAAVTEGGELVDEPTEAEAITPKSLEAVLAEREEVDKEAVTTLQNIQEMIADEPLLDVLVALAEAVQQPSSLPEMKPVLHRLAEIQTSIAIQHPASGETVKTELTPELTQQILELLRLLGYEHPGDVLIQFTSLYGVRFLLDAMHYLALLQLQENRQEFLAPASLSVLTSDARDLARLGKLLFQLMKFPAFDSMPV